MSSERIYFLDSYVREFTARVLRANPEKGCTQVALDRTAFHPEGGGQPSDGGTLGGFPLDGVTEKDGVILHRVRGALSEGEVVGQLDWERRFDFMQQHSGQHILSQVFERLLGAPTVSFHMGLGSSTIDVATPALEQGQVDDVERLANSIVFEDRPILVHLLEAPDLSRFHLRKATDRVEGIRVVQIQDFDVIPCGGTHCRSTGEVGLVKVVRWDRRAGNSRVEFLCGARALQDYQAKNLTVLQLASSLSVKDREVAEAVERLRDNLNETRHREEQLMDRLLDHEAEALFSQARVVDGVSVVSALLADHGPEELKRLAGRITARPRAVALLAGGSEKLHLVFARSEDLGFDVGQLLRKVLSPLGGKGGGQPNIARGGLPSAEKARIALEAAFRELPSAAG